jgi:UDP-N-acetylglucosamine 3-dehydrogenase
MADTVRIGIIGSGSIATHRHAPEYFAHPAAEIAGFMDRVPERAEKLAKKYETETFPDVEAMLADDSITAVSVCTANAYHAPLTIKALDAGKHVLCEKPIATSNEEAREMIAAAQKNGKFLMVGHNQRLAPLHVKAKQLIEAGEIGKILSFRTSFQHPGPETWSIEGPTGWFFDKKQHLSAAWAIWASIRRTCCAGCWVRKSSKPPHLWSISISRWGM